MKSVTTKKLLIHLFKYVFLTAFCLIILYPVLYAVLGSFKSNYEVTLGGTLWPKEWMFSNYMEAWHQFDFFRYAMNSLFLSFVTTVSSLAVCSMCGFCLSRKRFRGKALLEKTILATMFVSIGTVTLRPIYLMMVRVGMHNSLWPVVFVILSANMGTYVFLISKFVDTIPRELDEAARIDGCSHLKIFWKIIAPLTLPGLISTTIYAFIQSWNEYMFTMLCITSDKMKTLPVAIGQMASYDKIMWNDLMAASLLSSLPVVVMFIFLQRYFISSMTQGAVKG